MNPLLTKLPYLWRPWSWACASPGFLGTEQNFVHENPGSGKHVFFFFGGGF